MKNLALPRVQKMQPYRPPLANRRDFGGILLDFNEKTLPPSKKIISAIDDSLGNLQVYPEYSKLEERIAQYAGVKPEHVMITNGSDQAIEVIFRTFSENGDKVVIPSPSFDMFFQNAGVLGNEVVSPEYKGNELKYPLKEVLAAIDATTKLVVVCNPNNPTGGLLPISEIEKIAQKASSSIVCVDEAYFEFSGVTAIDLINKYPNVIITRTFSKAFGLAALRVGYVIADKLYIDEMLKVRSPYPVNMAGYSAAMAALNALENMQKYTSEVMQESKPYIEQFFTENHIKYYPSMANFILFKPDNAEEVYKKLLDAGILVRPQNKQGIEGAIRLSIGTKEQMKRFCEIYKKEIL